MPAGTIRLVIAAPLLAALCMLAFVSGASAQNASAPRPNIANIIAAPVPYEQGIATITGRARPAAQPRTGPCRCRSRLCNWRER
jgi:hypothetical protein